MCFFIFFCLKKISHVCFVKVRGMDGKCHLMYGKMISLSVYKEMEVHEGFCREKGNLGMLWKQKKLLKFKN